jgi:outer membrane protein OmpA-like peptidoglycan-associated protein
VITIDQNTLIVTKRDGTGPGYDEDLVMSQAYSDSRGEMVWDSARSISASINTRFNEGACSISADGRTLIFTACDEASTYGSCDLFIARKIGDQWGMPQNMGKLVNSRSWDSQPSLSPDGQAVYFASTRSGGYGGKDIWMTVWENGEWQRPINLGPKINTPMEEATPHIHFNNTTLFFASDGHPGFGRSDLFQAQKLDTMWVNPQNLGSGFNDHYDQISLILNASGTEGYYAQEEVDERGRRLSKLMQVKFDDALVERAVSYITGKVTDSLSGEPLGANIQLSDLANGATIYRTQSDPVKGTYYFALREQEEVGVYVNAKGYLFKDFNFQPQPSSALRPDTLNIALLPITRGASAILQNIYFDFDRYELDDKSKPALDFVVNFLKTQSVKIEISGHTDNIGDKAYNQKLSEKRAQSVYEYLVAAGVDQNKISYVGYGSQRPLTDRAGRVRKNRRIEFQIIEIMQ